MFFEYSWYFFNVQMYNDCQSERFLQFIYKNFNAAAHLALKLCAAICSSTQSVPLPQNIPVFPKEKKEGET